MKGRSGQIWSRGGGLPPAAAGRCAAVRAGRRSSAFVGTVHRRSTICVATRHRTVRCPCLLVGNPCRPVGERPDGDAFAVVGHRTRKPPSKSTPSFAVAGRPTVIGWLRAAQGHARVGDEETRGRRTPRRRPPPPGRRSATPTAPARGSGRTRRCAGWRPRPPFRQGRILHSRVRSSCARLAARPSQPSSSHMFTTRPRRSSRRCPTRRSRAGCAPRFRWAPVRGHVVHVPRSVGPDDVDELVDVDLAVGHQVPSSCNTTLPISLRGSSSTTSKRTGTL